MKKDKKNFAEEIREESMQFDQVLDDAAGEINPPECNTSLPDAEEMAEAADMEKLKRENAELTDKYLRVQAEYQNYRKRTAKDMAAARSFAMIDTLTPFLQLFDNFSMAMNALNSAKNIDTVIQGLNLIDGQYQKALDELGVTRFNAVNTAFDPNLHEAVANENSDTVAEGIVIRQWNCGYKMGSQVLRPARVVVSSGPEELKEQ